MANAPWRSASYVEQSPVSWGDPLNYCMVKGAKLCGQELLLSASVFGVVHSPEDAEIVAPGRPALRLRGHAVEASGGATDSGGTMEFFSHDPGKMVEVRITFACSPELQCAKDVLFAYAPGYTSVSILDTILESLANLTPSQQRLRCGGHYGPKSPLQTSDSCPREAWKSAANVVERGALEEGRDEEADVRELEELQSEALRALEEGPTGGPRLGWQQYGLRGAHHVPRGGSQGSRCSVQGAAWGGVAGLPVEVEVEERGKREDGSKRRPRALPQEAVSSEASQARSDTVCAVVEAGHSPAVQALARRLRGLRALREAWHTGDVLALVATLERMGDEALASSVLRSLQAQPRPPLTPQHLAGLLPMAQRIAQRDCEDHAVAAMRFVLRALEASWPAIAKALRNVATPKATRELCEEVATRLSAFLAVVKAMSRSVRIQRTNGPLVTVCRKLKASLEEALVAVGRARPG